MKPTWISRTFQRKPSNGFSLLLAVLCAQALPHQPISPDRGRGAVFSAATADVTLPPGEGETAQVCTLAVPCPDKRLADAAALPPLALAAALEPAGAQAHHEFRA